MNPNPGQLYDSPHGPALYVRTEIRKSEVGPEHMFVVTRNRVVFECWGIGVPEGFKLVADPGATDRAAEVAEELAGERVKTTALGEALRRAVTVVPVTVANELRRVYREAL